jgi:hypothetical protein
MGVESAELRATFLIWAPSLLDGRFRSFVRCSIPFIGLLPELGSHSGFGESWELMVLRDEPP